MNVGLVIIGNELLSGKFADLNSHFLAGRLFGAGARVCEIITIPDVIETVVAKVREYSGRFDLVITTGGIGPTHDDITFEAVALALEAPLEQHSGLLKLALRRVSELNEAARKLTLLPRGAELLSGGNLAWPPVKVGNVVVLPGIPSLIEAQWPALEPLLPGTGFTALEVKCLAHEVQLAEAAAGANRGLPDVEVGSYPILAPEGNHVLIRFTGQDPKRVASARDRFLEDLPANVKVETQAPIKAP